MADSPYPSLPYSSSPYPSGALIPDQGAAPGQGAPFGQDPSLIPNTSYGLATAPGQGAPFGQDPSLIPNAIAGQNAAPGQITAPGLSAAPGQDPSLIPNATPRLVTAPGQGASPSPGANANLDAPVGQDPSVIQLSFIFPSGLQQLSFPVSSTKLIEAFEQCIIGTPEYSAEATGQPQSSATDQKASAVQSYDIRDYQPSTQSASEQTSFHLVTSQDLDLTIQEYLMKYYGLPWMSNNTYTVSKKSGTDQPSSSAPTTALGSSGPLPVDDIWAGNSFIQPNPPVPQPSNPLPVSNISAGNSFTAQNPRFPQPTDTRLAS